MGGTSSQQGALRALLSDYLQRPRAEYALTFRIHGVDLAVTTDREDSARAIRHLLGHAQTRRQPGPDALCCYVITEDTDRPAVLDRFSGAKFLMQWETTGYFAWNDLCLIDFYPWATAIVEPDYGICLILLNAGEIPPPLIFSNQLFYQTLELLLHGRGLFPVHASAVASGRRAVLFPAPSEYGKTTLALTMVRAGYRYLGDDKPMIARRAGRPVVLAFPEPVNGYVDELGLFPELAARPHPDFPPDFPLKMTFAMDAYRPGCVLPSAIPKALVFPDPRSDDPDAGTVIEPISRVEGLRRLIELNWPMQLPWSAGAFIDMMRDLADCAPCYRIRCGRRMDDIPARIGRLIEV